MGVAELLLAGRADTEAFGVAVDAADASDIASMLALAEHPDRDVRRVVSATLPLLLHGAPPTGPMIAVMIGLTLDPDARVRDYACFALAEQWRVEDTPAIRDALAARLDDIDRDTRSEALVGLAYRRDHRAFPRVLEALSRPSGQVWRLEMVAAGALSDPQLHDLVRRHQDGWTDEEGDRTAELVARLTDPAGPGRDVLDGMAELCRRRARDQPDGDALNSWHLMDQMLDIAPHRAGEFFDAVLARLAGDDLAERQLHEQSALGQLADRRGTSGRAGVCSTCLRIDRLPKAVAGREVPASASPGGASRTVMPPTGQHELPGEDARPCPPHELPFARRCEHEDLRWVP